MLPMSDRYRTMYDTRSIGLRHNVRHVKNFFRNTAIYMICDYYIHKTDLADLTSFKKKLDIFVTNIEIYFTFRIRKFTTRANQLP